MLPFHVSTYQQVMKKNPSIAGDPNFSFLFHVTLNLALQKLFEPLISSNPLGGFFCDLSCENFNI